VITSFRYTKKDIAFENKMCLGSIETQSEKFNDDDARQNLSQSQIIDLPDDFTAQKQSWHPKLFLLNSCIDKEDNQIRYSLKTDDDNASSQIYVREHHIVKVKLIQHPTIASGINKEVFEAQQEWHLYKHVET
jgi:hypothetical protein